MNDKGKQLIGAMMLDEMAIRKHIQWNDTAGTFQGYVNMGTGVEMDSLPPAKDALVFMVVGVNGAWKVPVGYFLIDGLDSAERANLVNQCLSLCHEAGVKVCSILILYMMSDLNLVFV